MPILPLEKTIPSKSFKALFDKGFSVCDAPYGQNISPNFLEQRLWNSSIYSTDCSKMIVAKSGELCGFALANLRTHPLQKHSNALCLNLFFITESYRNQGLGRELIQTLVAIAKNEGHKLVQTSLQWAGIWPGIFSHWKDTLAFCQKTGGTIKPGEIFLELDLQQPLSDIPYHDITNCKIRPYLAQDFDALQQLVTNHFSIGWQQEVLNKVNTQFESFNGYGLASPYCPEDVLVVETQTGICGFCIVQSTSDDEMSFFGPIGIEPRWRGKGIGNQLLLEAIHYLRTKGKTKMGLWTNQTIYQKFYSKWGFQKTFETVHVEWRV